MSSDPYRDREGRHKAKRAGVKMFKVTVIVTLGSWAMESAADAGTVLASDADLVTFLLSLWFMWWFVLCSLRVAQGYYMVAYPPFDEVFWKYAHKIRGDSA